MRTKTISDEVVVADEGIVAVGWQLLQELKQRAGGNVRQRIRLCAHTDVADLLHEMFIVHAKRAYIRPHKHLNKSESYHLIEGAVDCVVFDEAGRVTEVVPMAASPSKRAFFCRVPDGCYHTLLIRSDTAVFHETTRGPFNRADTVFAPWAPEEGDHQAVGVFLEQLAQMADHEASTRGRQQ